MDEQIWGFTDWFWGLGVGGFGVYFWVLGVDRLGLRVGWLGFRSWGAVLVHVGLGWGVRWGFGVLGEQIFGVCELVLGLGVVGFWLWFWGVG